jgi:hypothetical protein
MSCYCIKAAVRNKLNSPPHSPPRPVDVRETLEYKKALALQLWMEEQQAIYKTQQEALYKAQVAF